jgi:DNA-binding IclR family transcriptional regulator
LRLPLGVASAGLAILAYMPEAEVRDFFARIDLTADYGEAHHASVIDARLKRTRTDGYSLNPGLVVEGSWGIAAAVFTPDESPVAALSLTGVEHRFRPDRQRVLGPMLLRAAHRLSEVLVQTTQPPSSSE